MQTYEWEKRLNHRNKYLNFYRRNRTSKLCCLLILIAAHRNGIEFREESPTYTNSDNDSVDVENYYANVV